jgi:putative ABC transport system permease protein
MNEVFGIPAGAFATGLVIALAAGLGTVAVLAARNRVFVKLGLRNIPRRRGRSALIVGGLMLGTAIIAAALATGDTMSKTVRSYVVTSLGETDEIVSVRGTDVESVAIGDSTQVAYFTDGAYRIVREQALRLPTVDGVAPAIVETVALQDLTSRQNEPRVTLFASDPSAISDFSPITAGGRTVSLVDLRPGEVYVNGDAAEELNARPGDHLQLLTASRTTAFRIRDIVEFDGAGTADAAVLTDLTTARGLFGVPGQVEHVLISNRGDELSGAALSDEVVRELQPTLASLGLEIDKEKADGLEAADLEGAAMMTLFTTFGSFSIAAGILLIFLIFVMLAAERRGELGIARAVGTRRGHLVEMFVFEGVAYDLVAAVVGTALGVAVAFGMVYTIASSLSAFDIELAFGVTGRSIVIAYTLGVLLTLVVVAVSAWRVSRLNITAAVRNLPDTTPKRSGKRRFVLRGLAIVLGALLIVAGIDTADAVPFMVGVSVLIITAARISQSLGVPDRLAYTLGGAAIVVFWLLPMDTFNPIADFAMGYGVFLAGGLMIVVGATWLIMYNAPLLLRGLGWALGRFRAVAPVLRLAVAYPLRSLFRTGVTLAMFMLVVFTLVTGVTVSGSFEKAWADIELFGGGFDVRAVAAPASPVPHIGKAVRTAPGVEPGDVRVAASQSVVPLEATQEGTGRPFESYPVTGLDDRFLARTTYGFAAMADGYESAEAVWRALRTKTGLAVVDGMVAPRRDNYDTTVKPDFQLSGFYADDGRFEPVPVLVRDEQTGQDIRLTVIGVLSDTAPQMMMTGISTSQRTLEGALGARAAPTVHWIDLAPQADARATAAEIESALLANGVEAEALEESLDDMVAYSRTFNYLIEGFMGLGLVVGVAALGVISARAVVERRQQIGVLRSIGFRKRMIQAAFLIESSFVALTAIVVGTVLGLAISYSIIADVGEQASWGNLTMQVPWLGLGVIFFVVYAVALLTTLAPAVRASRVYPAEALRYQ